MCGTRGSSIVSNAAGVLWMSVVRGMRGIGEVCEMCMCLARGCVGGKGVIRLGLGFTNPKRTGGMLDVCLCLGCGGVGGEGVGAWTRVWRGGVVLCLCEMFKKKLI